MAHQTIKPRPNPDLTENLTAARVSQPNWTRFQAYYQSLRVVGAKSRAINHILGVFFTTLDQYPKLQKLFGEAKELQQLASREEISVDLREALRDHAALAAELQAALPRRFGQD